MDSTRFLLLKIEKNLFEYPTLILLFLNYHFFLRDVVLRVNIFETNKVSPQKKKKIVPNTAHFTEVFLEKKIFKLTLYFVFEDELTFYLNKLKLPSFKTDLIEIGPMEKIKNVKGFNDNDSIQRRNFDKKSSYEIFAQMS